MLITSKTKFPKEKKEITFQDINFGGNFEHKMFIESLTEL